MSLKYYGAIGVIVAGAVGVSEADKSMNYTQVEAYVVETSVDCFVKNSDGQIVQKDTEDRAYMDCDIAPMIAKQFDYPVSAVQKRAKFEFAFTSPVDGVEYTDNKTIEGSKAEKYATAGKSFKIYAHNEKPSKTRF